MTRRVEVIGNATLYHGDCLEVLRTLADNSIDSIVTDPPYGLAFMGKRWDYDVPSQAIWEECLRVLKPGGHLLAFAGTRTQHRMAVRIEDAGFEIRDMIAWVYGSGFPKSLDVSKAIDKAAGAEREVVGPSATHTTKAMNGGAFNANRDRDAVQVMITAPATDAARQWQGWGTALKPALEPITVARKPLVGTVAENVLAHGTGALNIDGCRVDGEHTYTPRLTANANMNDDGWQKIGKAAESVTVAGRWPANLIHDGSDEVMAAFPNAPGQQRAVGPEHGDKPSVNCYGDMGARPHTPPRGDTGSAARFFYCAKASKRDRDEGLDGFEKKRGGPEQFDSRWKEGTGELRQPTRANLHPTVKPTDLMRYLVRLVTPPGGVVLDPFMGSGSTGKAAIIEGFRFIGIEREPNYFEIACRRIEYAQRQVRLIG